MHNRKLSSIALLVVFWALSAAKGVKAVCPIQRSPGRCYPSSFTPEWWEMFEFVHAECKRLGMALWTYDQLGYGHYGWLEMASAQANDPDTRQVKFVTEVGAAGEPISMDLPEGTLLAARAYPVAGGSRSGRSDRKLFCDPRSTGAS
jgi:hypothetical protein